MSFLNRDDLQALYNLGEAPCVSLFMPTFKAGAETQQNPIRFKNLYRRAKARLEALGHGDIAEDVLSQALPLMEDYPFWQHQSDGLAVFFRRGDLSFFRLPHTVEELVIVGDHYHLSPLLPLLTGDGRFYILALSQHRVRLLEATRTGVRELDAHDIPSRLEEVVGYDWEERSLQFHTGTPPSGGPNGGHRRGMFHGQNIGGDKEKLEVEKFLHAVDRGLGSLVGDHHTPIVLAGVSYLTAMFRHLSHYPTLMPHPLTGNADTLSAEELQAQAWPLVEPHFRQDQLRAAQTFAELTQRDQASNSVEEVVPASHDGRVETLFIAEGAHIWGTWDEDARTLSLSEERRNGQEDLVDRAALETFLHGGTLFAVAPDQVPGEGPIAALYRY